MLYYVHKVVEPTVILRNAKDNSEISVDINEIQGITDTIVGYNRVTGKLEVKTLKDVCDFMKAKYKLMGMNLATLSIATESNVDKYGYVKTSKVYLITTPYVSYIKGNGKDKPHRITLGLDKDVESYATDLKIDWDKIFRDYIATVKPEDSDLCELYFDMPLLEKGFVEQYVKWVGEIVPRVIVNNVVFTENFNMDRVQRGYYCMFNLENGHLENDKVGGNITYADSVKVDLSGYECSLGYEIYGDTSDRVIQPKRRGETK